MFRGCVKIAQQGYWAGGKPRYGFRRLLLNEARQPVHILEPGERKSIQNQRVTLNLGDDREVAVVRRIFNEFTAGGRHERAIAERLNHNGIPSPGGSTWDGGKIREILLDERYTGTMIYNRTTQKLKTPSRRNPQEKWIRTPESFQRVIEPEVFAKAQRRVCREGPVSHAGLHARKARIALPIARHRSTVPNTCRRGHAIAFSLYQTLRVDGCCVPTAFQRGSHRRRQPGE